MAGYVPEITGTYSQP